MFFFPTVCSRGRFQELIADYYGEATAFYFAWMGFYTQGLVVPSIFGVIMFGGQVRYHGTTVLTAYNNAGVSSTLRRQEENLLQTQVATKTHPSDIGVD